MGVVTRNGMVLKLFGPKIKVNIWIAGGGGKREWGGGARRGASFLSKEGGVAVVLTGEQNIRMRCSRVARASDSQCRSRNCPGFDPSILRHSGICGAADIAVLNQVHT